MRGWRGCSFRGLESSPYHCGAATNRLISHSSPASGCSGEAMKTQYAEIAFWSWLALLLVWLPGYFTGKRARDVPRLGFQVPISILLVVCFVFLFNPALFGLGMAITPQTALFGVIGLTLDLIGIAFAIWARLVLGRNWSGLIVTVHEEDELVQKWTIRARTSSHLCGSAPRTGWHDADARNLGKLCGSRRGARCPHDARRIGRNGPGRALR